MKNIIILALLSITIMSCDRPLAITSEVMRVKLIENKVIIPVFNEITKVYAVGDTIPVNTKTYKVDYQDSTAMYGVIQLGY